MSSSCVADLRLRLVLLYRTDHDMWLQSFALFGLALGRAVLVHGISSRTPSGSIFIADEGVGHRSTPVTRWRTSIRCITTNGTYAANLREFDSGTLEAPVGASTLTHDPSTNRLYIATSYGIFRTNIDGSNPVAITVNETRTPPRSLAIADGKLYYGTSYDGLIKRVDLDGGPVEVFMNVSQGLNYPNSIGGSYLSSYTYAAGLAIDKENGKVYWSTYTGPPGLASLPHGGSIRRASFQPNATDVEVLAQDIYSPGQLRLLPNNYLYWTERGQYNNQPTTLRRAQIPQSKVDTPDTLDIETLFDSNQNPLLNGSEGIMGITSFAVDEDNKRLWFSAESDARVMYGKIVKMGVDGGDLQVLNENVTEIGVPVGLEYIRP